MWYSVLSWLFVQNYSSSQKRWYFHSALLHPDGLTLFLLAFLFLFYMYVCTISNNRHGCWWVKMKSQLICLPSRINSFILPRSSKVFWGSALLQLFDFEQLSSMIKAWLGAKSAIDDDWSCIVNQLWCASIAILHPVPFYLLCMEWPYYLILSGRDRIEWKCHYLFGCYCKLNLQISIGPPICTRLVQSFIEVW